MEQLFIQVFDVFSSIQHKLQMKVDAALGRDAPNWSMRYGCPACGFEVCSLPHNIFLCLIFKFFSSQMRSAWSLHGCMPLMAAILKSVTKWQAYAMTMSLKASIFSHATSWMVSRTKSSRMQLHAGQRMMLQMLWNWRMALWFQRMSLMTAAGATGRQQIRKSSCLHQRRHLTRW